MTNRERIERLRHALEIRRLNQLARVLPDDLICLLALLDEWEKALRDIRSSGPSVFKLDVLDEALALLDAEGNPNG